MTPKRRILVLIPVLILLPSLPVFAWNGVGHMAGAYVAYPHLNPATKTRVAALLKLNPDYSNWVKQIPQETSPQDQEMLIFMIAATWADQIKVETEYSLDGAPGSNGNLLSMRTTVTPPVIAYTSTSPTLPVVDSTFFTRASSESTTTMAG